jgi:uncharacterized protein (DUF697 family)
MKNRPAIIVCGQYASGKTSLIKAITPDGTVPDAATTDYADCFIYETEVVDFIDAPSIKVGEPPATYWENLQQKLHPETTNTKTGIASFFNWQKSPAAAPWECVWYCIDGSKAELNEYDIEIMKLGGEQTIAIITQLELLDNERLEILIAELEKFLPAERIITTSSHNKTGLNKLLECSKTIIFGDLTEETAEEKRAKMTEWDSYFAHCGTDWSQSATKMAEQYLHWGTGRAVVIAVVPLPLADVIPLIGNEAYMIYRIGTCYGYAVNKTIIASFMGCIGGSITGKIAASFIPFLKAPIAGAVTYAVGRAAMAYFESDMTLSKDKLNDIFTFSKSEWEEIKEKYKSSKPEKQPS